jgi:hypothetical protein
LTGLTGLKWIQKPDARGSACVFFQFLHPVNPVDQGFCARTRDANRERGVEFPEARLWLLISIRPVAQCTFCVFALCLCEEAIKFADSPLLVSFLSQDRYFERISIFF